MIILLIDTSDSQEIRVGLRINKQEQWIKQKTDYQKAQIVLPLIDKILRKKELELKDLTGIEVNVREGSFTGVRVGISVANALGLVLRAPVKKVVY